jgi:hypothetical protein
MPFDPHSRRPVLFKNNGAVILWFFMAFLISMLVSCSKDFQTGPGVSASAVAFIALVWVPGLVFAALALRLPKIRVEISPDGVLVREWAPLWKRKRRFAAKDLTVSSVVKNEDSEGVSYSCSLLLPGKESIVLAQGGSLHKVESTRIELISALMTAARRAHSKA